MRRLLFALLLAFPLVALADAPCGLKYVNNAVANRNIDKVGRVLKALDDNGAHGFCTATTTTTSTTTTTTVTTTTTTTTSTTTTTT